MKKICIIGHFGLNKNLLNGQTIKTKFVYESLVTKLGEDAVNIVDTHLWTKHPIKLFYRCIKNMVECEIIIILPAQRGLAVFASLFCLLNNILKKKLAYIVIGGWLPEYLTNKKYLTEVLKRFNYIFVETTTMREKLSALNFSNIIILPNFKTIKILDENELNYTISYPLKLCTFSRVMEEKGITDIIDVIKRINNHMRTEVFSLDIYGQIDDKYRETFNHILQHAPKYIQYKGFIQYDHSVEVLREYFALVFPTKFYTEGIPGTIIDSLAAGLPIISSEWENVYDIIDEKVGFIYKFNCLDDLYNILLSICENPETVINKKRNCLLKAKNFTSDSAIMILLTNIFYKE